MDSLLRTNTLYLPNYVKNFVCQQCGACCLAKWRIDVDTQTYEKVKEKYVSLNREEEFAKMISKDDQGRITMNFSNGRCAALTDRNLCTFQKEHGHEFLSDTCKTFPRYIFVSPRGIEFALSFSCPAVAAALKEKEKITFSQIDSADSGFDFMRPSQALYFIPEKLPATDLKHYYFQIEAGLINIMQDRSFAIGERLVLIGRTLDSLTARAGGENMADSIAAILAGYKTGAMVEENYCMRLNSVRQLLIPRMQESIPVKHSAGHLLKVLALEGKLNIDAKLDILKAGPEHVIIPVEVYRDKLQQYYEPFRGDTAHILENYFVNYIFRKGFYFSNWPNMFFIISLLHTLIQFYIIGLSALQQKPVDEDTVLRAIMEVDSAFLHSEPYLQKIWEAFQKLPDAERHKVVFNMARA
jgi:lysine-N-methylase